MTIFGLKSGNFSSNTFDSQTGYKRFDAGLYVTAGYQLPQGLRLNIAHEIGLINLQKNNPDEQAYPLKKLIALVKKKSPIN
ncbi:hypothetical protein GO755_39115 [Spirosoma sp. HMF4905]|uniref:Uncharacterized protein n=1 Tax=Spirosoma arboris TaxID=2682092 RepID=A0A7K1SQR7_9BACT|nr:hypothetical protein [Spirosoma arboris]MVM36090.1 hypothetical protein [Spirosoma arboris]